MPFVVKHDDGLRLEGLDRADIILVGVSRTSKTPLSIYLAIRGYFVANVPIVYNVEPQPELFKVDQNKVVALRMDPIRLRHIREQRFRSFREDAREAYIDAQMVQQRLGPFGLTGFFCNGEIGTIGDKNFLHGYTASLALFVKT